MKAVEAPAAAPPREALRAGGGGSLRDPRLPEGAWGRRLSLNLGRGFGFYQLFREPPLHPQTLALKELPAVLLVRADWARPPRARSPALLRTLASRCGRGPKESLPPVISTH